MSRSLLFLFFFLSLILTSTSHGGADTHDEPTTAGGAVEQTARQKRSLIIAKIICLVLIFVGTLISGVSPYFFKWSEGFLVLGTQFAGGVFLGTAMMHFLSDANETFETLTTVEYPFAFMLACAGYLLIMLADCVVAHVIAKRQQVGADSEQPRGMVEQTSHDKHHHKAIHFGDSILLIIALCFHSVFEGIAIGVAENKHDAYRALWTIGLHKLFAAIAMGIALLRMLPDRPFLSCLAYAFAFAISSPIGVAIGIVIDAATEGKIKDWIFAISMSLACGVFVYVSIIYLLAKGYTPPRRVSVDTPYLRFLAVFFGIGVMAVVMIWD